jgi:hypothetical protein
MTTLTAIVILGLACILVLKLAQGVVHRVRYALEVRHLPKVSEWQARQNAAPLSSAIIHVVGEPSDRGDN